MPPPMMPLLRFRPALAAIALRPAVTHTTTALRHHQPHRCASMWKHHDSTIRVILTQDMDKLGFKGQEVSVKRGYARNTLVLQGVAVYSTPETRKQYNIQRATSKSNTTTAAATPAASASGLSDHEIRRRKWVNLCNDQLNHQRLEFCVEPKLKGAVEDGKTIKHHITATEVYHRLAKQHAVIAQQLYADRITFPNNQSALNTYGQHQVHVELWPSVASSKQPATVTIEVLPPREEA